MRFTKDTVKKVLEIDEDGYAEETIDVRFVVDILKGQSYEDIKAGLHHQLDKRFNEMFAAELGIMPQRLEEGERWQQQSLFDNPVAIAVDNLRRIGAKIGAGSMELREMDGEE